MTLTPDDVRHVASLARLGLSPDEAERFGAQLGLILDHISRLDRVDVSGVAETAQVGQQVNVWREDSREASLPADVALANAPEREAGFFRVGAIQE